MYKCNLKFKYSIIISIYFEIYIYIHMQREKTLLYEIDLFILAILHDRNDSQNKNRNLYIKYIFPKIYNTFGKNVSYIYIYINMIMRFISDQMRLHFDT